METSGNLTRQVVVAMSGGVDSSVAAAILVEKGFQVTGVMMRTRHDEIQGISEKNTFRDSLNKAQKISRQLNIPFEVMDVRPDFRKKVIDYFITSHENGITPNPCFVCNRQIKWGLLLEFADSMGAEKLASGHYAQVKREVDGFHHLYKAFDSNKDQSYVLSGLDQKQLSRAMFPLGEMTKKQTRDIAHRYGFDISEDEESQDLCFLEGQNQEDFLRSYSPGLFIPGEIKNTEGKVLGEHSGLALYTIGQRKGIRVSYSEPLYVLRKDLKTNTIIVGTKSQLGTKQIWVRDVNWICGEEPGLSAAFQVKVRYRSSAILAEIKRAQSSGYNIVFNETVRDPTPGQYAVFYEDDQVVGSGIIAETFAGEI